MNKKKRMRISICKTNYHNSLKQEEDVSKPKEIVTKKFLLSIVDSENPKVTSPPKFTSSIETPKKITLISEEPKRPKLIKPKIQIAKRVFTPAKQTIERPKLKTPKKLSRVVFKNDQIHCSTEKTTYLPFKSLPIRRIEKTSFKSPSVIQKSEMDDPILKASIYLDFSKDKPYNYVSDRMKAISKTTSELRNLYKTELKELPNIKNNVTQKQFDLALSIYENNQVYYQDRIDDKSIDLEIIKDKLTELEKWFININEPKQKDDLEGWIIREKEKARGISSYCDPELHSYIKI